MKVLAELTRWGEAGYHPMLKYGVTWQNEQAVTGWMCSINYSPGGSVSFGSLDLVPFAFHPTDPLAAARDALRQAGHRWPEMAVQP